MRNLTTPSWRIIPVGKWLGSPPFISHLCHLEGEQPYLEDLLTMFINHIPTGMILQVDGLRYPDLMPRSPHDAPVDLVIAAFAENLGDLLRKNEKVLAKKERGEQ